MVDRLQQVSELGGQAYVGLSGFGALGWWTRYYKMPSLEEAQEASRAWEQEGQLPEGKPFYISSDPPYRVTQVMLDYVERESQRLREGGYEEPRVREQVPLQPREASFPL